MSTAKFNTLQNAAGSISVPVDTVVNGSAKAWVNFNGTGTVAIRAAFNVSSITDNGVGDYTVNFTSAMVDASYSWSVNGYRSGGSTFMAFAVENTAATSSLRINTVTNTFAGGDYSAVTLSIFR